MPTMPVRPDRGFWGNVEGDTLILGKPGAKPRCQGQGALSAGTCHQSSPPGGAGSPATASSSAPWHLTRWPRSSSKTNTEASHANSVELWSIALAVPAQAPAIAARAAVCAASAKDTKFSTVIQMLCRSTGPEMARGAFEDNDKDAPSATPSR